MNMPSPKLGKTISKRSDNKRPSDPIDRLIIEDGLRIKDVYVRKDLDLLLLVLNNGTVLRSSISAHKRLKGATRTVLSSWNLIAGGRGVQWEKLDEDLSLRGFIQETSLRNMIHDLSAASVSVMI